MSIFVALITITVVIFIINRRGSFIGNTQNSILKYFNDVVMYDPEYGETVNKCTECNVIYSDYVRHSSKSCPRCNGTSNKIRVNVKMYKSKRSNYLSIIKKYWKEV